MKTVVLLFTIALPVAMIPLFPVLLSFSASLTVCGSCVARLTVYLTGHDVNPKQQSFIGYMYMTQGCGTLLNTEGSYSLSKNEQCSLIVAVPEKSAVQITVSGRKFSCKHHFNDIMIESMETKLIYFPCIQRDTAAVFIGDQREYIIHTRNVPSATHIGIAYYKTQYECGDAVPYDVVGIPLTVRYTYTEDSVCSIILPGRTRAVIHEIDGANTCIRFKQGNRLGDFALQSRSVCNGADGISTASYDILCSIGVMLINSLGESIIQMKIEAPTPDELDDYRLQSYTCSGRFIDLS